MLLEFASIKRVYDITQIGSEKAFLWHSFHEVEIADLPEGSFTSYNLSITAIDQRERDVEWYPQQYTRPPSPPC